MKWLGISFPEALERELREAKDPLETSIDVCERIFLRPGIPPGKNASRLGSMLERLDPSSGDRSLPRAFEQAQAPFGQSGVGLCPPVGKALPHALPKMFSPNGRNPQRACRIDMSTDSADRSASARPRLHSISNRSSAYWLPIHLNRPKGERLQ